MGLLKNPFSPGAGTMPPELAGRQKMITICSREIESAKDGRLIKHQVFLGLRGVGKTVLLREIEKTAKLEDAVTSIVEAQASGNFQKLLADEMRITLQSLLLHEKVMQLVKTGFSNLISAATYLKVDISGAKISVDPRQYVPPAHKLSLELKDIFVEIGNAAKVAGCPWVLLIDEVQYLSNQELEEMTRAIHQTNQLNLPVIVCLAGVQVAFNKIVEVKTYAERLFNFNDVGMLSSMDSRAAILNPIESQGHKILDDAIALICEKAKGYPYFIQHFAFHAWECAQKSPITHPDVEQSLDDAIQELDRSFFSVRMARLASSEVDYLKAMASLGEGPYETKRIAAKMHLSTKELSSRRDRCIKKGMIYSPNRGFVDYTAPLFADYLKRQHSN